jgi:antitoxin component of MazEF toxin-antitoxin module
MVTALKTYGNTQAFQIPKSILELFGFTKDTQFQMEASKDGFVFRPINNNAALVEKISDQIISEDYELLKRLSNR